MNITQIREDKNDYIHLLSLLDDERKEDGREGDLYVLFDEGEAKAAAVIHLLKNRKCELKGLSSSHEVWEKGYARQLIHFLCERYSNCCDVIYTGTANSAHNLELYEGCGFTNAHIVVDYFIEHSKAPLFEDGKQITDMVYMKKKLETEIDVKKVVDMALEAGRILLKNGGEIFRVEETITRICNHFRVQSVDIFTLSHGIFVSAENGMQEAYTRVKHVPLSAPHLGIVAEVNDLSREISAGNVSIDEALIRLKEIDNIPFKKNYFQVLAAGLGSAAFGFLLGASAMESLITFVIGCILYVWVLIGKKYTISKILINIIGGIVITTLALAAVYIPFPVPIQVDSMIIGSIMPLVPGVAFVNAIRDIADSDFLSGTVRMIDAILVFVYIALGVGVTLSVYNNVLGGLL